MCRCHQKDANEQVWEGLHLHPSHHQVHVETWWIEKFHLAQSSIFSVNMWDASYWQFVQPRTLINGCSLFGVENRRFGHPTKWIPSSRTFRPKCLKARITEWVMGNQRVVSYEEKSKISLDIRKFLLLEKTSSGSHWRMVSGFSNSPVILRWESLFSDFQIVPGTPPVLSRRKDLQ